MFFISFASFAQGNFSVPDYQEIEKLTRDKSSAFFYDKLFERYERNDTTLTLRDYRMLYYGYFFQPGYAPFKFTDQADTIKYILSMQQTEQRDWQELERLGNAHLKQNPFDLKGINVMWLANRQLGDSLETRIYFDKLKKLVQTILSSGDGLSETTAFHVQQVSHEYDILNILGFEFSGKQNLTDNKCDFLSVKANDEKLEGLYFDVKQMFKGYEKALSVDAP